MSSAARLADLHPYRLTVEQYRAMHRAGILGEDDPIELIDGVLVEKMTKNPPHRLATKLVRSALEAVAPSGCYVDSQEPIAAPDSEPEPDVVLVRGAPRDYADRHPSAGDLPLVVEIADDSLERDRGPKLRLYARAGVPVYWLVNLRAGTIEVYGSPGPSGYGERGDHVVGDSVPVVIDGREVGRIPVSSLLP